MKLDPTLLSGIAALIVAIVGYFTYRTKNKVDGANTAIDGLDRLTTQMRTDLDRCLKDKEEFGRTIAKLEGQLDVLKVAATGPTGEIGITGRRGATGSKGEKGDKGKDKK